MSMGLRDIYPGWIDMIIYQIYQLVGSFPAKFVSSGISQNIFFHMIGNKSFHFIFWEGGVSKTGLYLKSCCCFCCILGALHQDVRAALRLHRHVPCRGESPQPAGQSGGPHQRTALQQRGPGAAHGWRDAPAGDSHQVCPQPGHEDSHDLPHDRFVD